MAEQPPVTLSYVILAAVFGAITTMFCFAVLRRRDQPFLYCYAVIQLAFCYGLLVQQYSFDVSLEITAFAHLLFLFSFVIVLLTGAVGTRRASTDVLAGVASVPVRALIAAAIVYLAFQAWLVVRYGATVLAVARLNPEDLLELNLSFWEVLLSSALRIALIGVLAIAAIRHAMGRRIGAFAAVLLAIIAIAFVSFGESPIGARRLIIFLAVLWIVTAWMGRGGEFLCTLRRRIGKVVTVCLAAVALSIYYQAIRNNLGRDAAMAADVLSGEPTRIARGLGRFLLPVASDDPADVSFFRPGPLDFFIKVVDARVKEGRSTDGEASGLSLALAVPKALYPGVKPVGDVDDVLLAGLEIIPSVPFSQIDYPTSIAAIGMADYGISGVVLLSVVVGLLFRLYWLALGAASRKALVTIVLVGALVQIGASHEAGLTSLIANARDVVLFASFGWFLAFAGGVVRTVIRQAVSPMNARAARWRRVQ